MKELSLIIFLLTSFCAFSQRPNVIVIYTDDQGTIDLNTFGATDLETPNIDAIVNSGVKFTQFYASPICSPSRASLLTGKVPQRTGLAKNASVTAGPEVGLRGSEYTMAEMFQEAGYTTAHIGKWHVGYEPDMLPNAQGFDFSFGHYVGCIDNYSHFYYWKGPNRHDLYRNGEEVYHDGEFFPDLMVQEASAFIEENSSKPFFLYFATNMPHYPYQGDQKWLEYYQGKGVEYPRVLYNAFLSTFDDRVGMLLEELDKWGLRENTIIVFQSDNGHSTEERAHFGGGNAGIYRGAKQCLFEGGIRVPAAISWPKGIAASQTRDQVGINVDWMPTLAELCGIPLKTTDLDGHSLVSLIEKEEQPSFHEDGYCWQFKDMWAVRKGKWKLLGNPFDTSDRDFEFASNRFLVDLEADPGERVNLASINPAKVEELEAFYNEWLDGLQE